MALPAEALLKPFLLAFEYRSFRFRYWRNHLMLIYVKYRPHLQVQAAFCLISGY